MGISALSFDLYKAPKLSIKVTWPKSTYW